MTAKSYLEVTLTLSRTAWAVFADRIHFGPLANPYFRHQAQKDSSTIEYVKHARQDLRRCQLTDHETTQIYEKAPSSSETTRRILGLGSLTLLTITAAAILHVNQPEFIFDRFLGITEFEYSLFDSVLYLSYLLFGLLTGAFSDRWSRRREFVLVGTSGSIVFYWLDRKSVV